MGLPFRRVQTTRKVQHEHCHNPSFNGLTVLTLEESKLRMDFGCLNPSFTGPTVIM